MATASTAVPSTTTTTATTTAAAAPANTAAARPPVANPTPKITSELIQKYLDENQLLINAIVEHHEQGKLAVVTQYQLRLQQNLIFLATLADAPPSVTSSTTAAATGNGSAAAATTTTAATSTAAR